jgi:hypothetical protein
MCHDFAIYLSEAFILYQECHVNIELSEATGIDTLKRPERRCTIIHSYFENKTSRNHHSQANPVASGFLLLSPSPYRGGPMF